MYFAALPHRAFILSARKRTKLSEARRGIEPRRKRFADAVALPELRAVFSSRGGTRTPKMTAVNSRAPYRLATLEWCRRGDSNAQPSLYKSAALPLCYVGAAPRDGLEPPQPVSETGGLPLADRGMVRAEGLEPPFRGSKPHILPLDDARAERAAGVEPTQPVWRTGMLAVEHHARVEGAADRNRTCLRRLKANCPATRPRQRKESVGKAGVEPAASRLRVCSVDRYGTCPKGFAQRRSLHIAVDYSAVNDQCRRPRLLHSSRREASQLGGNCRNRTDWAHIERRIYSPPRLHSGLRSRSLLRARTGNRTLTSGLRNRRPSVNRLGHQALSGSPTNRTLSYRFGAGLASLARDPRTCAPPKTKRAGRSFFRRPA